MASTVSKKKPKTSKSTSRPTTARTRRVSIDEDRLAELIKRSVREALEEARAEESDAEAWDRQMEADAKAGKLDSLTKQAMADFRQGKASEL